MSPAEKLSNIDIALYVLYKLGGTSKKIHTEEIAWEAFKLAKDRFSWRLPEFRKRGFPDKTLVYFALSDAKKKKYGKLIAGRAGGDIGGSESEGWRFTPQGVEWFLKNEDRINYSLKLEKPISSVLPKQQAERFIKKIQAEKIFRVYREKGSLAEASIYDFADMLNCSPDANRDVMKQKFDLLKSTALTIEDQQIKAFLNECEKKFHDILIS